MYNEINIGKTKTLIKKFFKKLGSGVLFGIGVTLGIGIISLVYATWTSLPTQISGSPLTSTIWNDLVNGVNDIGKRTDNIYSTGGNIGIGVPNPSTKLEVNGDIKANNILISSIPAFRAYVGGGSAVTFPAGVHIFNTKEFDNGNNYNTSNGRFIAPINGIYFFKVHFFLFTGYNNTTNNYISIMKNGNTIRTTNIGDENYDGGLELSAVLKLNAGDYINTHAQNVISTFSNQYNSFEGFLVSGL